MTIKEPKDPYGDYPTHFLAESPEEAEELFIKYSALLNGIAYTYSMATGIEKGELFGEAIMGLAKALKKFDKSLGYSFKTFAVKVIKRDLDEYSKRNSYTVYVPAYIKRAHRLICNIKNLLGHTGISEDQIEKVLQQGKLGSTKIPTKFVDQFNKLIKLLKKEAKRDSVSYKSLIDRAEFVPLDVEITDDTVAYKYEVEQSERDLEIALFVEKLKEHMTDVELSICEGIMNDKTYEQIAQEHNKTAPWVRQNLDKMRKKLSRRLKDGSITL